MRPNSIETPLDLRADGSIESSQIMQSSHLLKQKKTLRCIRLLGLNCRACKIWYACCSPFFFLLFFPSALQCKPFAKVEPKHSGAQLGEFVAGINYTRLVLGLKTELEFMQEWQREKIKAQVWRVFKVWKTWAIDWWRSSNYELDFEQSGLVLS